MGTKRTGSFDANIFFIFFILLQFLMSTKRKNEIPVNIQRKQFFS